MRSKLTRCVLLAGTFTFAVGCGHDNTLLPNGTHLGSDSLAVGNAKYGDLYWPYKIVITPAPVPALALGATVKLNARVTDPVGTVLMASVVWTSSNAAVATVATDGTVTAKGGGTAVVRGTTLAVSTVLDSAVITVQTASPASVKTITVALSANNISPTAGSQATATLKDSVGQVLTGRTVTWTSSSPAVATVNATSGVVTAVAAGTSTISATSGTVTGSATITVTPPIVSNGNEILANLPKVYLNTTMPAAPAAGGKIISVAAGGNLQAAINSAVPGDVIELANGATFTGTFALPNKGAGSNWIVIRPANMSGVPAEGSRMTPSRAAAANLPKIIANSNQGAINTDFSAHHYRFVAIEVSVPATILNTGLIRFGSSYETSMAQMPHDLVLDRMYIHGTATGNNRRCVTFNGASSAIVDSYVSDCHEQGSDAQAVAGWSGPGPFKIVNNYLEASSENIMFGGGDPAISGLIPSDIEIRRNHVFKPASWKGGIWTIKNLFELKNAQRVLVEGNIFENNWAHAQGGSAINLKSVNQGGTCRWCVTQDVTFRYNLIKNTGSGFVLSGYDDQPLGQPVPMTRVSITDNVITGIDVAPTFTGDGRGFLINGNPIDLTIAHNTLPDPTNTAVTFGGPTSEPPVRMTYRDNIAGAGQYCVVSPGVGAAATIATYLPVGGWRGNVMIVDPSNLGASLTGTSFTTMQGVGFTNYSALDFRLLASSAFRLKATDGRDPGADVTAVNSAIAGVVVP